MTERDCLLKAICSDISSDSPRLALADWLDEHDEAERAEFVRIQLGIEDKLAVVDRWVQTPSDQPGGTQLDGGPAGEALAEAQNLQHREQELLERHGYEWCAAFRPQRPHSKGMLGSRTYRLIHGDGPIEIFFTRGWPSSLKCSWSDWLSLERAIYWAKVPCERCNGSGAQQFSLPEKVGHFSCSDCRGTGAVEPSDECENCGGDGEITPRNSGHSSSGPCPDCGGDWNSGPFLHDDELYTRGSGRVPRPFPATACPLESVTLLDWPRVDWVSEKVGIDRMPFQPDRGITYRSAAMEALAASWPRLTFHLPTTDAQRAVTGFAPGTVRMREEQPRPRRNADGTWDVTHEFEVEPQE